MILAHPNVMVCRKFYVTNKTTFYEKTTGPLNDMKLRYPIRYDKFFRKITVYP